MQQYTCKRLKHSRSRLFPSLFSSYAQRRLLVLSDPKPGSVSLVTTKTIVSPVTVELGLVLEENLIIAPHVETRLYVWSPDNGSKHIKTMGYILV